jgi:RNA polymerase sigma factor (sigma-70 family)
MTEDSSPPIHLSVLDKASHVATDEQTIITEIPEIDWFKAIGKGGMAANKAIDQLYRANARQFLTYLRARGLSIQEAEDVVSQLFERLLKQRGKLSDVVHPRGYMWKMLKNCYMDYYRSVTRQPDIVGDDSLLAAMSCNVDHDLADYLECVSRVIERFRRQAELKAEAIDLAAFGGLDGKEIALALGKTYGAAREFLSQARKELASMTTDLCGVDPRQIIAVPSDDRA